MGFPGELVKSVFSINRSTNHHETKVRSNDNGVKKRSWLSVKSYLCGDELNSVLAEEDSAFIQISEGTVSQPIHNEGDWEGCREDTKSEETVENNNVTENNDRKKNSNSKLLNEEEAAILIQSAYRAFLRRCQNEGMRKKSGEDEELSLVMGSPDGKSMGTSIEVQTGTSIEVYTLKGEKDSVSYHHRSQQRSSTHVLKQKEDWDDSTVSSYSSKMRMQNRIEATTTRERALAYAFSQQLRISSNRQSNKFNSNAEPNMSWSWLERWMATRLPDTDVSVESHGFAVRKRFLDVSREEKESCGSNEVPFQFDNFSTTSQEVKDHEFIPPATKPNNSLKGRRRTMSRRKTVPSYHFPEEHLKVSKRESSSCVKKDNGQLGSRKNRNEIKHET